MGKMDRLLARLVRAARAAERELTEQCPTFEAHQIKEKFGRLRLYVEFDLDDDLPDELRAVEPGCPSLRDLAKHLGVEDAPRDGPLADAWQAAHEAIFTPAFTAWSERVEAFRASQAGDRAADAQQRRAATFEQLVKQFEAESATTCDSCGAHGDLSCSPAPRRWYAVRCDRCRDAGWTRVPDDEA